MFEHQHHINIHSILNSLNPSVFVDIGAYFGGGTLITLLHNEYRWSKDIDFVCPLGPGYKRLRDLAADNFFRPDFLFQNFENLNFPRELRADQYGVRFLVEYEGNPIKFEIFCESRIKLNRAKFFTHIPVPCLDHEDQCTEKLLANADRWLDQSIESRDLIDLGILRSIAPLPDASIEKASNAYDVIKPLEKSVKHFLSNDAYRHKCFSALEIEKENAISILSGIKMLAEDYDIIT